MSSGIGLGELIVGTGMGFGSKPWASLGYGSGSALVEVSASRQLKALQEETRFSYEHLALMLSKIRKYQSCQRSQNADLIGEDSLDMV
jgi:hypothetical protein